MEPETSPSAAVIVVLPMKSVVARPSLAIVATAVSEEAQLA